jgi:tetratricopeptide (TPR) repeat protein/tRNA A-37 threonylcarbamoyl transferase component Bud32
VERLWAQGQRPDPDALLKAASFTSPLQVAQVLAADQWQRWHAGERIRAENYFARHPTLAADPAAALLLVYGEVLVREELGEAPSPESYLARFPQCADGLRRQLSFRGAIAEAGSTMIEPGRDTGTADPTPVMPLGPWEHYELLEEIGRGGMGVVYKARDRKLNRLVALKMIRAGSQADAEHVVRFLTEAEAVAQLQHANIVPIYEVGRCNGLPYFTLELVGGGSLARKLWGGPLSAGAAARLVEQLAQGIQAAHQRGIVHRDLKPDNVLLAEDGTPKITDFGLAKHVESGEGLTVTGVIVGTPSYMAPEQARGKTKSEEVGPAADIYALGAILYEVLTGRPPFKAATTMDTLWQVVHDEPVPPSQLQSKTPRDLETICLKCLRKAPEHRYASAAALAKDLRLFQAGQPIQACPVGRVEWIAKWARRRPAVAALSAALLLAVTVGLMLVTWKWREESAARALAEIKERQAEEANEAAETAAAAERSAKEVAESRLEQIKKTNEILVSVFRDLNPSLEEKDGPPLLVQLGERLDKATELMERGGVGDALAGARLQVELGRTQFNLGHRERAIALLTKARPVLERELGLDHIETLIFLNTLALAYEQNGQLAQALPLYEQTLTKRKAKLGLNDPGTLQSMHNLAAAYMSAGRLAEALPLFELTLEKRKAKLGPDHSETLTTMNNLGWAYVKSRQLRKAVPLLEQTLEKRKAVLGPDHFATLTTMNNLGSAYVSNGQSSKAVPLLEHTLEKRKAKFGPDHPRTLTTMYNLARAYEAAGKLYLALPLYEQTLEKQKANLRPDHPDTLGTMHNLALLYKRAKQFDKALPLFEQTVQKRQAQLGPEHPDTLNAMNSLGRAYQAAG